MVSRKELDHRFITRIHDIDDGKIPEVEYVLLYALKKNRFSILDIGANIGTSAYFFLKNQPNATIYSFEPNVHLIPCLETLKKKYPQRMNYFQIGLSDTNETCKLYVPVSQHEYHSGLGSIKKEYALDSYNSLFQKKVFEELLFVDELDIETKTADSLNLPEDCGLVKIDVEGAETRCIKGMMNFLRSVRAILLVESLYDSENVKNLLADDYEEIHIYDIIPNKVLKKKGIDTNIQSSRNMIFVPRKKVWEDMIDDQWYKEVNR